MACKPKQSASWRLMRNRGQSSGNFPQIQLCKKRCQGGQSHSKGAKPHQIKSSQSSTWHRIGNFIKVNYINMWSRNIIYNRGEEAYYIEMRKQRDSGYPVGILGKSSQRTRKRKGQGRQNFGCHYDANLCRCEERLYTSLPSFHPFLSLPKAICWCALRL